MSEHECDHEWEWDVEFSALCLLPADHPGAHVAVMPGNRGALARIEWNRESS